MPSKPFFLNQPIEWLTQFIGVIHGGKVNQYPQIQDNTLNFVVPCHSDPEQKEQNDKMQIAFGDMKRAKLFAQLELFVIQHHFNGKFLVFQMHLT